jgi:hypothetical protein
VNITFGAAPAAAPADYEIAVWWSPSEPALKDSNGNALDISPGDKLEFSGKSGTLRRLNGTSIQFKRPESMLEARLKVRSNHQ